MEEEESIMGTKRKKMEIEECNTMEKGAIINITRAKCLMLNYLLLVEIVILMYT